MNVWEKILESSGLPECRSIADHLCNAIGNGISQILFRDKPLSVNVDEVNQPRVIVSSLKQPKIHISEATKTEITTKPISGVTIKVNDIDHPTINTEC